MSAFGLSNYADGDGGCSFLAAYRWANGSSTWASKGRRPSGAVLHSSREPVHMCGALVETSWTVRRLINNYCRSIVPNDYANTFQR